MKLVLVLMLTLALAIPATVTAATARPDTRSPSMAFAVAAVPGSLVHGLGNYYAGERKTAGILFTMEMFGIGLFLVDHEHTDRATGGGTALIGGALFVGSWLYDVMSAPEAAERHNRRVLSAQPFTLQLEPLAPTRGDPLQPTFRFTRRF